MYDSAREPVETLRATPEVPAALLTDMTIERARSARGGHEGWLVLEVVCHLRDTEEHALTRMRVMRDQTDPEITGFTQEGWARERDYLGNDLCTAQAAFRRLREEHATELAALVPGDWARAGRHDRHGRVTILNHTLHMAWHDAVHAAQIARQLTGRSDEHRYEYGEPNDQPDAD